MASKLNLDKLDFQIIQEMMEISGISPVSFPVEMSGASAPKSAASPTRVEAVLPKGQA